MVSRAARQFGELYPVIRNDIFKLCEALRFTPTRQQAEILHRVNVAKHQGILRNFMACKSGQGNGKSALAFVISLFRALQAPKSLVVLTAPTQRQARDAFLTRGREIMGVADPILKRIVKMQATKVVICGDGDWGIKTVTATDPKNAQGYHVPYAKYGSTLSIVMEEASGISRDIVEQFKGTISDPDVMILMIGNPNLRDCSFFDCFNSLQELWWTYTLNSETTALENPDILNPARNDEIAFEFGKDSDVYRIRVLGEFPFQDPDSIMSSEDLQICATKVPFGKACMIPRSTGGILLPAKQLSADFARFGGDENVVYQRLGNAIIDQYIASHVDPNDVVSKAVRMHLGRGWKHNEAWHVADAGGMGQGVMKNYYNAKVPLMEFHFGGRAHDSAQYENLVTEAYFYMAKLAKARMMRIPNDSRLINQLASRKYTTNLKGKLVAWSKDQYMKDGNDSPDRADSCVMAMYDLFAGGFRHTAAGPGKKIGASLR